MTNNYKRDFRAAFNFLEKWTPAPQTVEDWEAAAVEAGEIYAQNGYSRLLCDLFVAVFEELDRQPQERKVAKCG